MRQAEGDTLIRPITIGATPATIFMDEHASAEAPIVIIAHGFAGSQQLMRPLALSLAKRGYRAFTFDFLGHGRHPHPLMGDITKETGATVALMDQIAEIIAYARATGGPAPRIALVGHSMAADIIVRAAQADPEIAAVAAISIYSPAPTADSPRNFLIVTGEYEQALRAEALRIVRLTDPEAREGVTARSEAAGLRAAQVAPGVEHISVLYSAAAMAKIAVWLHTAFEREVPESGHADALRPPAPLPYYGPWLLALIGGVVLLAWPLSRLLPRVGSFPTPEGAGWGAFLLVAIAPAVITPLTLWGLQISFLPVLVGDYLAQHFALYGALTALGMWIAERRDLSGLTTDRIEARRAGLASATLGPKRWPSA
ncbi:MAG: alpha/beta hydrolase, partial [Rhodobacteraceae bacterium]|nr:alpha/beta hydrolase [Paracoccaceae bacterium]